MAVAEGACEADERHESRGFTPDEDVAPLSAPEDRLSLAAAR